MFDINKATDSNLAARDPEGNMYDLPHWSPLLAQRQAKAEGVYLTDKHWEVINFLRERYRKLGRAGNAREVQHELEEKFGEDDGLRGLYEMFPGGPVSQASRIAGVPLPPYSGDTSFGTVK